MATEKNILDVPMSSSPSVVEDSGILLHNLSTGDPVRIPAAKFLKTEFIDLSMMTIYGGSNLARETANSYVVRQPGAYKFPLVYGCGIKNGMANPAAYTNNGGAYQADFVNHLGNKITSPFIEANANCKPASCEIVWQDYQDLIQDLELVEGGDCKYLRFQVPTVPIIGANAVVAIKDSSSNIMWSWHIWVTSEDLSVEEFTNYTGKVYKMLPVNLGWTWDTTDRLKGKCPHFQWGRKDPMPPSKAYNSTAIATLYGNKTFAATAFDTVAESIKRPHNFFIQNADNNNNWNDLTHFYNFWDANCNATGASDNVTVKTIYDPCPPGFKIPAARAFTGFTATGGYTEDATLFNVVGSFANGWKFKRNSADTIGNFFPASGYRNRESGAFTSMGSHGLCWSAGVASEAYSYYLYFYSGYVTPLNTNYRAFGFAVRPVQE